MRIQRGFTLVEMMAVVFIIAILATMGFPAMNRMLSTQAVRSAAYDLVADLVYARSEAITRGTTVTLAGNSGMDYTQGWTITESAGGTTLRQAQARSGKISFTASQNAVTFDRSGRTTNTALVTFFITPSSDFDAHSIQDYQKRCVRLDPSGRPKSIEGVCS